MLAPMLAPWVPVFIRAASTACIVVIASGLAEAFGPFWGALVTSLPISSGPAYVFLAMEHSDAFIAAAALSSFTTHAAIACFVVTYALTAHRLRLWQGLGLALLVWLVASTILRQFAWSIGGAVVLNLIAYGVGLRLVRGMAQQAHTGGGAAVPRRWYDVPLRAITIAAFVTIVVLGSTSAGISSLPFTLESVPAPAGSASPAAPDPVRSDLRRGAVAR